MRRQIVSLALTMTLVYFGYGFACSKASMASAARDVVSALTDIQPILQQAGLPTDKVAQAITLGNKLVTYLEGGTTTNPDVIATISGLISAFNQLAAQTDLITNQHIKTLVIVSLGIANVALHYISNHVERQASGRLGASHTIAIFNKQKVWACRNAQTGRYEKMSFCKAHPDVTTVETR